MKGHTVKRYAFIALIFSSAALVSAQSQKAGSLASIFGSKLATKAAPADTATISITDVLNGATNLSGGVVAGSWVTVKGTNFSSVTTDWSKSDFSSGNLPTSLGSTQVIINGVPAAMYFINPTQANVQAPSSVTPNGPVTIQVTNNGVTSQTVTVNSVPNAPGVFAYSIDQVTFYPAATFVDGTLVGDPAQYAPAKKPKPGDTIVLYTTGLVVSPAGTVITSTIGVTDPVTVMIGTTPVKPSFTGLVAPGEFQINITIPQNIAAGNYPLTVQIDGQTSQSGITLPITN
jgi:uncharacterized protein (TIGR03437 family)